MPSWIENELLFFSELKQGYEWQKVVYDQLRTYDLDVRIPELSIRASISDIPKYKDELDLEVNGRAIEVKSRRLTFTCPEDFPYECAIVDTVRGFNSKRRPPTFVLMVSRKTNTILGIHRATKSLWYSSPKFDNIRRIRDDFYIARKRYLMPLDDVVTYLKGDRR